MGKCFSKHGPHGGQVTKPSAKGQELKRSAPTNRSGPNEGQVSKKPRGQDVPELKGPAQSPPPPMEPIEIDEPAPEPLSAFEMTEVMIIDMISKYLPQEEQRTCRVVHPLWDQGIRKCFDRRQIKTRIFNDEELERYCDAVQDAKKDSILFTLPLRLPEPTSKNAPSFQKLSSNALFTSLLQHLSISWDLLEDAALLWGFIGRLENLKTLELTILPIPNPRPENETGIDYTYDPIGWTPLIPKLPYNTKIQLPPSFPSKLISLRINGEGFNDYKNGKLSFFMFECGLGKRILSLFSNIKTLEINVYGQLFLDALNEMKFPNLKELTVHGRGGYYSEIDTLHCLRKMPQRLTKLDISFWTLDNFQTWGKILGKHSTTLTSLTMHIQVFDEGTFRAEKGRDLERTPKEMEFPVPILPVLKELRILVGGVGLWRHPPTPIINSLTTIQPQVNFVFATGERELPVGENREIITIIPEKQFPKLNTVVLRKERWAEFFQNKSSQVRQVPEMEDGWKSVLDTRKQNSALFHFLALVFNPFAGPWGQVRKLDFDLANTNPRGWPIGEGHDPAKCVGTIELLAKCSCIEWISLDLLREKLHELQFPNAVEFKDYTGIEDEEFMGKEIEIIPI